jgi:serine/threonine-protein kinase HipA
VTNELIVLLSDRPIGTVSRDARARLTFRYDERWRDTRGAYPLSLSMPLAAREHPHDRIDAFIWGLLPDNELVLDRWAKKFQVSPRNAFPLIANVGEDCAGAVQFVRPERLDALLNGSAGEIAWLDEADIAERLRALRDDQSAWRRPADTGQFSLAGAQPKTALLYQEGRWGVPSGRIPTTHILKPPSPAFDGHAENEHFCLALARSLGLPAASSQVVRFADEIAFVVERYDRQATNRGILRIHQEDMCQATGVPPTKKYENEGGPGVNHIVELLRESSSEPREDVDTFVRANAFNWLVGGTDAHAKNYSILIGTGGRVRLAPLYDVASIFPYDDFDPMRIRLAMKLGGKYRFRDIAARSWDALSDDIGLDKADVAERVEQMITRLPEAAEAIRTQMREEQLDHAVLDRLVDGVQQHVAKCARIWALR